MDATHGALHALALAGGGRQGGDSTAALEQFGMKDFGEQLPPTSHTSKQSEFPGLSEKGRCGREIKTHWKQLHFKWQM